MENKNEKLNVQFSEWRKQIGVSQRKLSELSGIPQKTISKFEDGSGNPTMGTVFQLLEPLHLKIEVIYNDEIL